MSEVYPKIDTIYKRDERGRIIEGSYSRPEFEYLSNNEWLFTEKVDGTNVRVEWDGSGVGFKGKTDNASLHPNLVSMLHRMFAPERLANVFESAAGEEVTLYGEGYGPKIQSGGKYRSDISFVLFDVRVGGWWLRQDAVRDCAAKLGIEVVPILRRGTLSDAVKMTRTGFMSTWAPFTAEGLVMRPKVDLCCRDGSRVITKIKHKDFANVR